MLCECGMTARKATVGYYTEDYWECNHCGFSCCSIPCECCIRLKIEALKCHSITKGPFRKCMGKYLTKDLEEELKEYL